MSYIYYNNTIHIRYKDALNLSDNESGKIVYCLYNVKLPRSRHWNDKNGHGKK